MGPLVDMKTLASVLQFAFSTVALTITNGNSEFFVFFLTFIQNFYFSTLRPANGRNQIFFDVCLADECACRFPQFAVK